MPNNANVPGIPLQVDPAGGGEITLSWDASCLPTDIDYEIYQGPFPHNSRDFTRHIPRFCSTMGMTMRTFPAGAGSSYFLVVPHNAEREGSYGTCSAGGQRTTSLSSCHDHRIGCP